MRKIEMTEQQTQEIIRLIISGISCAKIGKIFNVSWATINRIRQEQNVPRVSNKTSKELELKIIELYNKTKSCKLTAKELNITKRRVLLVLKRNDIKRAKYTKPITIRFKTRLPAIEQEEFINLYVNKKIPVIEIAKMFNIHRSTVMSLVRRYNIKKRTRYEELSLTLGTDKKEKTPRQRLTLAARNRITPWTEQVKKRDKKCMKCGSIEQLEAHHLKSFCSLINEFFNRHPKLDLNIEENFNFAINTIVTMHTLDIGITVCNKCHCEIDEYRKFYKNKINS